MIWAIRANWRAAAALGAALAGLIPAARACELVIVWQADLGASPAPTGATGTASLSFDFIHPSATVRVDTKGVTDVREVALHVARSYSDHAGPTVVTLYAATAGQMPPALTRRISEADLRKQAAPKISSFADLVQAVVDGRAYVTVATKDHPQGELSGFITMHKEAVYTDTPGDIPHDPALHRAYSATTVHGTVSH